MKIKEGDKVIFKGEEYTIFRRIPKEGKGEFYLYSEGKKVYLSSLYPVGDWYVFDDRSFYYRLEEGENGELRAVVLGKKVSKKRKVSQLTLKLH